MNYTIYWNWLLTAFSESIECLKSFALADTSAWKFEWVCIWILSLLFFSKWFPSGHHACESQIKKYYHSNLPITAWLSQKNWHELVIGICISIYRSPLINHFSFWFPSLSCKILKTHPKKLPDKSHCSLIIQRTFIT